jgi:hypothetical protein
MYAPSMWGQHLCSRFLTLACPGFLTVADIKGDVGATREPKSCRKGSHGRGRTGGFSAVSASAITGYWSGMLVSHFCDLALARRISARNALASRDLPWRYCS